MDVYDVIPEVVGPRPVAHLLGPDLRTALCGEILAPKERKPSLLNEEQRKHCIVCFGCIEIMEMVKIQRDRNERLKKGFKK